MEPSVEAIRVAAREAFREHEALLHARDDELRRARQAAEDAERAWDAAPATHPHFKARMAERLNDALGRIKGIEDLHRTTPVVPPLTLTDAELAELRELCRELPRLWRHPNVTAEHRKVLVRLVIQAVHLLPERDVLGVEIEWTGGARTTAQIPRHRHVVEQIREAYNARLSDVEIVERLREQGIVHIHGKLVDRPYDAKAVAAIIRRQKMQRRLDEQAYPIIRERWDASVDAYDIADELNEKKIRHRLGTWTRSRVLTAVKRLRLGRYTGSEPLPSIPRLAPQVLALHDQGLSPVEIAPRLQAEGVMTQNRTPVTVNVVYAVFRKLKLKAHSGHVNRRVKMLLREWAATATLATIAERLNGLGLRNMRGGVWDERNVKWKLQALGIDVPGNAVHRRDEAKPA